MATSQKVPTIEKGSHPGTHNKGMDTDQTQPPKPKIFERRKKPKTMGAHEAHTVVQPHLTSETELVHKSVLDASPTNVEKQPHSLNTIQTPQSNTSSIALIDNPNFLNSLSLQLREEPTLQTLTSPSRETSFLDLLSTNCPNIEKITKAFTSIDNLPPTDNIQPTYIISSIDKFPSTDIPHPLTILNSSTDIHQSMDSPTELINQVLLGMRARSKLLSDGQAKDLAKEEDVSERTPTSSGGAKGEVESTTLASEEKGEDLRDVSFQDEILMKTVRETGHNEDLTSISIDEQMQIAKSMGIEVGGADKAEQYSAELTQEMGLSSGGDKEED